MTFDNNDEATKSRGLAPKPPESERNNRFARARESMRNHDFDGLLIYGSAPVNPDPIRYLSGYVHTLPRARSLLLLPLKDAPILFIDRDWHLSEARKMSWVDDIRTIPSVDHPDFDQLGSRLGQAFDDVGLEDSRIGTFEADMPAKYERALPDVETGDGTLVWHDLVTSPTDYDLTMIRKTAAIADEGLASVISACQTGKSEAEICFTALRRMASMGAEFRHGAAVSTHVNIGSFSEVLSNLRPFLFTGNRLRDGQMFWVDLIACYNGYYIDCDRTISVGEPTAEQQHIFDVCEEMYHSMKDAIEPGVLGGDIWEIGSRIASEAGYGEQINFVHFGHTTGLTVSEESLISEGMERAVQSGTIVNLEPGIFVPGVGSACIENALYVTDSGVEELTEWDNDIAIV